MIWLCPDGQGHFGISFFVKLWYTGAKGRAVSAVKRSKTSLKLGLMTTIVACWLVPIVIVVALAGVLLETSYRKSVQQELDVTAQNAVSQVQMYLQNAIDGSKAVSYDGIIRSAYREYLQEGHSVQLYRTANDYLNQQFSRDELYKAVFICFWQENIPMPYVLSADAAGHRVTQAIQNHADGILEIMADADTEIRFLQLDEELYMARNLLDSSFTSYATVVMMLDTERVFGPLSVLSVAGNVQIDADGCQFQIGDQGKLAAPEQWSESSNLLEYSVEVGGYPVTVTARTGEYDIWADNPWLRWAVAGVALMVLPILLITIALFTHHVSRPIQTLAQANLHVQSGDRGFQITDRPPNTEFEKLYHHFNTMSEELQNQFERSYLEQQASQRAQIKALQSQINPHFLNNTLEIINWEARLADNERVSAMIEALSTMLTAVLDRNSRPQVLLKEELGYVDAYLYIIRERLGDGFHVFKQIDPATLEQSIPRLILQPIVENAVEHDMTARHGGNLWVRTYRREERLVLEVEHDGRMTEADRERIHSLLTSDGPDEGQVGLRNVNQRLRLIYGNAASLQVSETENGTILARIEFPVEWI